MIGVVVCERPPCGCTQRSMLIGDGSGGVEGAEMRVNTDLAVAPDGTLYLTFRTTGIQGPTFDGVWISRSSDGGVSFSEPQPVARIRA